MAGRSSCGRSVAMLSGLSRCVLRRRPAVHRRRAAAARRSGDDLLPRLHADGDPLRNAGSSPSSSTWSRTFFAGEPIEDIAGVAVAQPTNRLIIRMQRNGNRIEVNDTLYFDIQNQLRGRALRARPHHQRRARLGHARMLTPMVRCTEHARRDALVRLVERRHHADAAASMRAGSPSGPSRCRARRWRRATLGTEDASTPSLALLHLSPGGRGGRRVRRLRSSSSDFGDARRRSRHSARRRATDSTTDFKVNFGERLQRDVPVHSRGRACRRPRSRHGHADPIDPRIGGMLERQLRLRSRARPRGAAVPVADVDVPNDQVSVEIDSLAPGGDAVGRQQRRRSGRAARPTTGASTFVPLAAPGERVRVRMSARRSAWPGASWSRSSAPGPDRVAAAVPAVRQLRRLPVAARDHRGAAARRSRPIVERALGVTADRAVVAAGPPFGYRDRAKLAVGAGEAPRRRVSRAAIARHRRRPRAARCSAPGWRARCRRCARSRRGCPPASRSTLQAGAEGVHVNVAPAPTRPAPRTRGARSIACGAAGVVGLSLGGQADRSGGPRSTSPSPEAAAARCRRAASRRSGAPATRRWSQRVLGGGRRRAGRRARALRRQRELHAPPGRAAAPARVHACDGDPAAVARGARNVPGAAWVARPPDIDRRHRRARSAARGRRRRAPGGRHARAPARRLRLVRSADAGARRAPLQPPASPDARAGPLDLMPQTFHVEVVATFDRPGAR